MQVIEVISSAKATLDSQIEEIKKEISDAEGALAVLPTGKDMLNEEGLPIKDIREEVFDEDEGNRAVLAEERPAKVYTMEEIDRMMDEAMEEERAEMSAKENEAAQEAEEHAIPEEEEGMKKEDVTAVAGEGLEVGKVSGEELIAKLVDDSKKRYNPMDGTWLEDEGEMDDTDDDSEDEDEEEEDQYGRTRGYLIPPNLSKSITKEKGVKFASFEKPATRSTTSIEKPVKSALKKNTTTSNAPPKPSTTPVSSTRIPSVMTTSIVERDAKHDVPPQFSTNPGYPETRYQGNSQSESVQSS